MSDDALKLMYVIHGILTVTNLIVTVIIVRFVCQISRLEFKIDMVLKIYEQSFITDDKKKEPAQDHH